MFTKLKRELESELQGIRDAGLWKDERVLASAQGPSVRLADGREVLVFCANNYLGLSSHPRVIENVMSCQSGFDGYDLLSSRTSSTRSPAR